MVYSSDQSLLPHLHCAGHPWLISAPPALQLQLAKQAIHSDATHAVGTRHMQRSFPESGKLGAVEAGLQRKVSVHKPI